jgi:hypothetical protein
VIRLPSARPASDWACHPPASARSHSIPRRPSAGYPLVCDVSSGRLRYDNYGGAWGEGRELDRFLQAYALEKAKLEARRQGHTVLRELSLPDGSIRLTIQVTGGAA